MCGVNVHAVDNNLAVYEFRNLVHSGQRNYRRDGDGFLLVCNLDTVVGGHIFKCVFSVSSDLTPHAVHIDVVKLISLIRCESYGDVLISSGNYLIVGPYICVHELRGAVNDFNFDGVSSRLGLYDILSKVSGESVGFARKITREGFALQVGIIGICSALISESGNRPVRKLCVFTCSGGAAKRDRVSQDFTGFIYFKREGLAGGAYAS